MPAKRLDYIRTNLNDANDATYSGAAEPITGLLQNTGLVNGDYFDVTDAEALGFTNIAVGNLYAGRYQRVRLDPNLSQAASPLKQGQLLFWIPPSANPAFAHTVTNVEPADLSLLAGIYNNTATAGTNPVTSGNFFFMQALSQPGRASILFRTNLTGIPAIYQSVYAAGAGAGIDNATADVLDGAGNPTFTQVGNMLNRYLGFALAQPVGATLIQISLSWWRGLKN